MQRPFLLTDHRTCRQARVAACAAAVADQPLVERPSRIIVPARDIIIPQPTHYPDAAHPPTGDRSVHPKTYHHVPVTKCHPQPIRPHGRQTYSLGHGQWLRTIGRNAVWLGRHAPG